MDTLDRIAQHMTVTAEPITNEPWRDYALTVERAGKTYIVGQLTIFSNGEPAMATPHHDVTRLATTSRAWGKILDSFGYTTDRFERSRATLSFAVDKRGYED